MNFTKIFGLVLLIVGIILIAWTLLSTYNIFTGKASAPKIFKVAEVKKEEKSLPKGTLDIQTQMEKMIGEQLKEIIPNEAVAKLLNLIAWSILASILIFGGSQISSLGIKLIKK